MQLDSFDQAQPAAAPFRAPITGLPAAGAQLGERRNLTVALLAICLVGVLAIAAVAEMLSISRTTRSHQGALQISVEQRALVRDLLQTVQDAVAARNSYLLTRNGFYLDVYRRERDALSEQIETLVREFTGTRAQRDHARRLGELASARMDQIAAVLEDHREASGPPLIAKPEAEAALRTMRAVNDLASSLVVSEEQEIAQASVEMNAELHRSQVVTIVAMVSIILLVAGIALGGASYLSRRNRIEQELMQARAAADAASQAKSDFLATMSHEIRTPLTSILGYAELLMDGDLSPAQTQYIERIQKGGSGLLAIVNDLLDFSKIEAGEMTLDRRPMSLRGMIADALSIVSVEIRAKNIDLVQEIGPTVPDSVAADALRLRQVLLNLLKNAVKFTSEGTVTLRVSHHGASPRGEIVRFEVTDTGVGIPPELHGRLFRRFSQLDSSPNRPHGGTGLGLAICRNLVLLMEGDIGVESEPGRGSTFWFDVPLQPVEHAIGDLPEAADSSAATGGRVLLVEDSPQNQDLVTTILRRAGYEVDVAADGEQALEMLDPARHELILMDMQMPRMDGLEATRRIRLMPPPAGTVPIIALTANVLPEQLDAYRKAGMTDHVGKPFRSKALVDAVRRCIALGHPSSPVSALGSIDRVHDPIVLEEALSVMGEEWIRGCMLRLKDSVGGLMDGREISARDRPALRRLAHQIVSDAGQLGFPDLSKCCAHLERAIAENTDIEQAHTAARTAARLAMGEIDRMLSGKAGAPGRARIAGRSVDRDAAGDVEGDRRLGGTH